MVLYSVTLKGKFPSYELGINLLSSLTVVYHPIFCNSILISNDHEKYLFVISLDFYRFFFAFVGGYVYS